MECSFDQRKRELEEECELPEGVFASAFQGVRAFMEPFVDSFRRIEQCTHAIDVVSGLFSDLERKNGESIAYHFGLDRKTIQHFIGESRWNDRPLRDELANQVGTQLGESDGILAFDPSAFPKSGKQSVGVARQWCGRLGKLENCQVGATWATSLQRAMPWLIQSYTFQKSGRKINSGWRMLAFQRTDNVFATDKRAA